jgi:hypothetical protein
MIRSASAGLFRRVDESARDCAKGCREVVHTTLIRIPKFMSMRRGSLRCIEFLVENEAMMRRRSGGRNFECVTTACIEKFQDIFVVSL